MNRLIFCCGVLIASIAVAAYADNARIQSPGYFTDAGAPLVTPYNQNSSSDSTAQKQKDSGYFPDAGAPLVAPDEANAGADDTASKQSRSGYFPSPDAPLVAPSTNGIR
jgi:hypothetical protein